MRKFWEYARVPIAAVVVALLAATGLGFASGNHGWPWTGLALKPVPITQPSGPRKIEFTDADGKPIDNTKVVDMGNGYNAMPSIRFADGDDFVSDDVRDALKILVLSDVDSLRALHLCAAELEYEQASARAYGDAVIKFPRDMPFDRHESAGELAERVGYTYRFDSALGRAITKAETAQIPCISGPVTDVANAVTLTVKVDGKNRQVWVPEYAIATTLEYYKLQHYCVDDVRARLTKLRAEPLDKVAHKGPPWNTFSERAKARAIADREALLQLLIDTDTTCAVPKQLRVPRVEV